MKYHVIYSKAGQVGECEIETDAGLADAERLVRALHPDATYWEIGVPLVEVEYDSL